MAWLQNAFIISLTPYEGYLQILLFKQWGQFTNRKHVDDNARLVEVEFNMYIASYLDLIYLCQYNPMKIASKRKLYLSTANLIWIKSQGLV